MIHPFANVLQPLIDFFGAILVFLGSTLDLGWGLAIIALTVLIRLVLLPVTLKQMKSMYRMAQFAPQLKQLQQKYKDDPQRQQREMMAFYRENKINPFASCLPLLAQLPVFLALFYLLQDDLRIDICPNINPPGTEDPQACGASDASQFLFINDLTANATGVVLVTLIVMYVGSQVFSFLLSASPTMDRTQRMIFLALPFFFIIFIWRFPAGLLVYWITTNVWTIVQGVIVRRRLGPLRQAAQEAQEAAKAQGGGTSLRDMLRGSAGGQPAGKPAPVAAGGRGESGRERRASGPPPPSPRKKKKRSGRRR